MKIREFITAIAVCGILSGCAEGGTVMLTGDKPAVARPTNEIELLLEKPGRPFKVIAMVNASAETQWTGSVSAAETLSLEQLKKQAAEAGADAVYEIKQEVMDGGQVVSSVDWGRAQVGFTKKNIPTATGSTFGFANTIKNYTLVFRAKAIKFK